MIKIPVPFRALLALIIVVTCRGGEVPYLAHEFDPAKWPQVDLQISQQGNVKNLFDSGLRPYRFPGLEKAVIEVKHFRLLAHLASGRTLPEIKTEWMDIKPFDDGAIASIEGATPSLSLDDARKELLKWLPFGTNGRSVADLDVYLKAVATDNLDFDDPYHGDSHGCSVGWSEPGRKNYGGGPQCGVWFRKTTNHTYPLSLYFSLSWGLNRTIKQTKFYSIPIPPPPGYEHVSMDAPKNFGPDSGTDILRARGVDIGESPEARTRWRREAGLPPEPDIPRPLMPSPAAPAVVDQSSSRFWWAVVTAFVLLVAAVVTALKLRLRTH